MKIIESYENFSLAPKLRESVEVSEGLMHHIENQIPLAENIFRMGSAEYFRVFREARQLMLERKLTVTGDDAWFLRETDIGESAEYEGEEVWLDAPFEINEAEYQGKEVKLNKPKRGGPKKFYVYTRDKKGRVVKVTFGAKDGGGELAVKLRDPEARANFAKRHDCENKNDKTTPGYWSCRLPRYAKQLGLSGGGKWW